MSFVVSDGSLRSLSKPSSSMPSTSLRLADDFTQDYAEIWRTQPAVRTVVSFLARNIASLRIHAFERVSDTDRQRLPHDHPLSALLAKPNPRTVPYTLINGLVHDVGIFDMAMWLKLSMSARPSLVRVPPRMIKPVGDNWMWADRFEIKGTKGKTEVDAEDVVYFHGFNPDDARIGCSPIESLRRVLAEDYEAGRMREQVLRNGARTSGYLQRPAGAKWSNGARERFRAQWQAQYAGGGPGAGGTPILEDGMEFVNASQTAEQLQYIQGRKLTREEAAAAYHLPAPMVGILDEANFGSMSEFHKMLYQDALGPYLVWFEEELGLQLVPDLALGKHIYVEFNLQEKLRGSFEEQAQQLQASVGAPWLLRNEARARMNLPALPDGDELVTPLNVLIGGQASPQDSDATSGKLSAPAAAPASPYVAKHQQVLDRFFDRQARTVKSAIGAGSESQWWDGDRWAKELAEDLWRLAITTSEAAAHEIAKSLGAEPAEYDVDLTLATLATEAQQAAAAINAETKAALDEAVACGREIDDVFADAKSSRSAAIALKATATAVDFGAVEVARQLGHTA